MLEYQSRFERLSNQARDWSDRQLLDTFIEGLIPEIRCEVKARQPCTMIAAISFANLYEKKISKERSARGLYYDEKWSMEHRCKQGQLLMIEPIGEEPKAKNVDSDHEGINSNEDVGPTIYTMHALADYSNPQTMEVGETLEHQPVIVLIDTGSTNNFMDSETIDRLAHHIEDYDRFEVKIVDGRIFTCDSKGSKIKLIIQGQKFHATIATLKDRLVAYTIKKWRSYLLDQRVVMRYR